MRFTDIALSAILLSLAFSFQTQARQSDTTKEYLEQLQDELDAMVGQTDQRGATATFYFSGRYYTMSSGIKSNGIPIESEDWYLFRSYTKLLVSTIIHQLSDEGKLSLDDPLSSFLDPISKVDMTITLRELLAMKANVCDFLSNSWALIEEDPTVVHDVRAVLESQIPDGTCNENNAYVYKDTNFQLLGLVIEAVDGENGTGAEIFTERLFDLLGENNSLRLSPLNAGEDLFNGLWSNAGNGVQDLGFVSKNAVLTAHKYNAGVVGNTEDVLKLLVTIMENNVVSTGSLWSMQQADQPGYGLGMMKRDINGQRFYGHGGNGLHISRTFYDPDSDVGIAVASNYSLQQENNLELFLAAAATILQDCVAQGGCDDFDRDDSFFSEALQENRLVDVHLPDGYYNTDASYPVIYFLHGATADQDGYKVVKNAVREMIANGEIDPVILVKPDGSRAPYAGSFFTSSELYGDIEGYMVNDLQEYIRSNYRADTSRTCIMGHSMGGFGAMKLGLQYPDKYDCIISQSGPLDVSQVAELGEVVRSQNGGSAPYSYGPLNGELTAFLITAAGALSPNLDNPSGIDFIFDETGEVDQQVLARWQAKSPAAYLPDLKDKGFDSPIYFDVGNQDEYLVDRLVEFFDDSLDQYGIEYRYETFEGPHSNNDRYPIGLAFADSVFKGQIVVSNEERVSNTVPESFNLNQNYPNPFNPSTNISFELPAASEVTLKVYNMLGQEVATLVSGRFSAGQHTVSFEAGNLSSGVYLYRISTGSYSSVRKMTLIK